MIEHKRKSQVRRKKELAGSKEPGDLIPMPDHQREFLKTHNMFVDNPAMELILAQDKPSDKAKMSFGTNPLPWEKPMNVQDFRHLKQAQDKMYVCKNKQCAAYDRESIADYYVVTYKREIPHSDTKDPIVNKALNQIGLRRFGRRENTCIHVGVQCKRCKQHIQYVKRSLSHRRAAKDPLVSGPHQRYGIKPTYS
jgi:hypothetical protein